MHAFFKPRFASRELPDELVERTELALDCDKRFCVGDDRLDFSAITNDARIGEDALERTRPHARHSLGIEVEEDLAVMVAFAQDRFPTQSSLGALERQHLEQVPVVVHRASPLPIVIVN